MRSHVHVKNHLTRFKGIVQVDGYQAYDHLDGIVYAGCLDHVRRKFSDIKDELPKGTNLKGTITGDGLKAMVELFTIERNLEDSTLKRLR